jgi:hypothetical protein
MITVPYGVAVATIDEFRAAQDRDEIRRALGLDPDATVLLCIAMFEPRKSQAVLALAFAEAAAAFPDAVLVLVGDTDNPYALGLRELAARLSLGPRLRLEPVARDPYRWYHAADAFVLASDVESMPRSLLEAMAFGLPVVAASAWGVPELVTDGVNGFLFPPRDLAAAYSGIRCLLSLPPEERSRVGRAGAALIRERHSVAGYADAYRKLVRGLLEEPRELPGVLLARSAQPSRTELPLSVVIATRGGWEALGPVQDALLEQVRAVGGEVIVASGSAEAASPPPPVRWIAVGAIFCDRSSLPRTAPPCGVRQWQAQATRRGARRRRPVARRARRRASAQCRGCRRRASHRRAAQVPGQG